MNSSRDIENNDKQVNSNTNSDSSNPTASDLRSSECTGQGAEAVELSLPDLNELGLEDVDESYPFC